MNIFDNFPSKYLKVSDIVGDQPATMSEVKLEQMEDGQSCPVLYFANCNKGLVLNKTNAGTIAGMFGPETSNWLGKHITLWADMSVHYQGRQGGIRIRPGAAQQQPAQQQPEQPQAFDLGGGIQAVTLPHVQQQPAQAFNGTAAQQPQKGGAFS